ncbi:MAG TPA: phage/plasmid primase, P4 family [Methanothrix sp.]|nr:phage/plasmid primase, P4 family [Methanothrix sp.]HOL44089.1 phage/plasmid primase, P4 family [Methanothrix sp.]
MNIDKEEIDRCLSFYNNSEIVQSVNTDRLARLIVKHIPIVTVVETGEMLSYYNGVYSENAKEKIHKFLVNILSNYERGNGSAVFTKHILNEVIEIVKGLTYVGTDDFDSDLSLINMKNGLYNWMTGEFTPHDPAYRSRIQIPVAYDPDADCPAIREFFGMVMEERDLIKMREFVAYCLYRGYPIQKAFILYGQGGTGKSHFLDILTNFLGPYNCASVSMHDLENDRFSTSDLHRKLLNAFGDMSQSTLPNVNILKMLTSGKDIIRAQKKGQQAFNFVNFAKMIFGTNKLPKVLDNTTGFFRRIELIPFDKPLGPGFDKTGLIERCKSPEEMSGLFNWVIPALDPLLKRGNFTNSFTAQDALVGWKIKSDPVGYFLDRYVLFDQADVITTKDDMYNIYKIFCKINGLEPLSPVWFGREFSKQAPSKRDGDRMVNGKRKTVWINIGFNPETIEELLFQ